MASFFERVQGLPSTVKFLLLLLLTVVTVQVAMMTLFGFDTNDPTAQYSDELTSDDGAFILVGANFRNKGNHKSSVESHFNAPTKIDRNAAKESTNRVQVKSDNATESASEPWKNPKKFSDLFTAPNGAIYGNPLLWPKCQNALLKAHKLDPAKMTQKLDADYVSANKHNGKVVVLLPNGTSEELQIEPRKKPRNLPPSLWTRESIHAMLDSTKHNLYLHCGVRATFDPLSEYYNFKRQNGPRISTSKNQTRTVYIVIGKCGSSTTALLIDKLRREKQRPFNNYGAHMKFNSLEDHIPFKADCSFTFVRDPISRLVSAYYTIQFFLWKMGMRYDEGNMAAAGRYAQIVKTWKFWFTDGEPLRFRTFCEEMMAGSHSFVDWHPLEHVVTITANLSPYWDADIHFIGRVERYNEHWQALSEMDACSKDIIYKGEAIGRAMVMEGTQSSAPNRWALDPTYVRWLSLDTWNASADSKYSLPAWRAIREDQAFFNRLVEHFWQDFVCFGYEPNYPKLNLFYSGSFQKEDSA